MENSKNNVKELSGNSGAKTMDLIYLFHLNL